MNWTLCVPFLGWFSAGGWKVNFCFVHLPEDDRPERTKCL